MFNFARPARSWNRRSLMLSEKDDNSMNSDSASEALLHEEGPQNLEHHQKTRFDFNHPILLHSLIFISYVALGTLLLRLLKPECHCSLLYSPAQEAIGPNRVVTFDNPHNATSPFRGQPREELHEAWSGLLQYHNIRVQESTLHKINRTSLPLNDEAGGFLVTLDVFHQIHCLNQVRQQIYHEHYYPEEWNSTKRFMHADHCIDLLRQVLMCRGDISLLTYSWIDGYRRPWPEYSVDHTCHNWDNLMEWASENYIPSLKGPILMHPELGPSWPEGEPETTIG
ncbi:tat pathway signal sequence [Halenospora varia]|nr:tat pathway signal sequence [Halenospora varia]